ncbi:MAG: hypothetical protein HeimC3_24020 [Candidatus Heimdallarchaeota archaeon LC_3]|nr:MAG: hypothetical protein HeimC3_24020 [Candidatus Heimdallarchaeota archaeon LC_3]
MILFLNALIEPQVIDLFTLLYYHMNNQTHLEASRFKGVRYFNGGFFKNIYWLKFFSMKLSL